MNEKIYASFEIGHHAWKFLVIKIDKDKVNILYSKMATSFDLVKNTKIINPKAVAQIIEEEVALANSKLNLNIFKIIYVIPSKNLDIQPIKIKQKFHNFHSINENDIKNLKNKVNNYHNYNEDLKLVDVVNNYYLLDDQKKYSYDPIAKSCKLLKFKSTMYFIPEATYNSYLEVFKYTTKVSLLFTVLDIFATTYSLSKYVENDIDEFIAIDYGHCMTNIIYMQKKCITRVISLKMGGYNIDKDINYYLNMNQNKASNNLFENLSLSQLVLTQNEIKYSDLNISDDQKLQFPLDFTSKEIATVIESRIHESLIKIFQQVDLILENKQVPIIFSGGATRFYLFKKVIAKYFDKYQAIVYPKSIIKNNANLTNVIGANIYLHIYNLENNKNLSSIKSSLGSTFTNKISFKSLWKNKLLKFMKIHK